MMSHNKCHYSVWWRNPVYVRNYKTYYIIVLLRVKPQSTSVKQCDSSTERGNSTTELLDKLLEARRKDSALSEIYGNNNGS